jgi:hypothetical protein
MIKLLSPSQIFNLVRLSLKENGNKKTEWLNKFVWRKLASELLKASKFTYQKSSGGIRGGAGSQSSQSQATI